MVHTVVRQYTYSGGTIGSTNVHACSECGGLVLETSIPIHDKFHDTPPPVQAQSPSSVAEESDPDLAENPA